jgi:EAL domain-containing protein (putative c-di-GMP-specific phosphodiesterase class I)
LKLAKVTAINRVAKKIGVKTIAEMVESEDTITSLREIGIDFAQGFGISRPRPLKG